MVFDVEEPTQGIHHLARRIDTFSFDFGTSQLIS